MKVLKPIGYCLLGFILAFACMYFISNARNKSINNEKLIDKDVPVVELQVSSRNVSVGDTVTYSIMSRVESGDAEAFENNRTFYYDFTGDGVWDLETKKDTATYTFLESYEDGVSPKVAVEFRGKLGQAYGNPIFVKQKLRPIILYNSIGNTVIFRDLSMGKLQEREICFEESECEAGNKRFKKMHVAPINPSKSERDSETIFSNNDTFMRKYDDYGNHKVNIYLKDVYGEEIYTGYTIKTKDNKENGRIASGVNMITIPETTFNNTTPEIFLSKAMNDTLVMYVNNDNGETCYVDTDISTDSDGDGKTDNDIEITCNKIAKIKYEHNDQIYKSVIGRIYFMNNGQLTFKDFYVIPEGIILELDNEQLEIYKDITTLINGIEDSSIENADLKSSLDRLRKNLNNIMEVKSLVITINNQISDGGIKIDIHQKELLDSILDSLRDEDTIVTVGMTEYEKNRDEILALLPTKGDRQTIEGMFNEFEEKFYSYTPEEKAKELEKIWNTIIKDGNNKWLYNEEDFTPHFCNIVEYYDLTIFTDRCGKTSIFRK